MNYGKDHTAVSACDRRFHTSRYSGFSRQLGLLGLTASLPVCSGMAPPGAAATSASATDLSGADRAQDNGTITIPARPTAIVSMSPTATEMLYAIGAGSQVKAVDSYSDYPKSAPMTKLNALNPNVEAIVAYKPDLVIVAGDTTGLTAQLAKFGIPVLSDPAAATLRQAYQQFDELGMATGHLAQAKAEVSKIKGQIKPRSSAAVPKHGQGRSPTTSSSDQTYYSVTSSTFIGQVLGLLGMKSIADTATSAASQRWLSAAFGRVHHQVQPELHLLGRYPLLRSERQEGGQTARVVGDDRGQGGTCRGVLNDDIAFSLGSRYRRPAPHRGQTRSSEHGPRGVTP